MPKLDYMVLADYVRQDDGAMHIMGAGVDTVAASAIPAVQPFGVALRLSFGTTEQPGEEHHLTVSFIGPDTPQDTGIDSLWRIYSNANPKYAYLGYSLRGPGRALISWAPLHLPGSKEAICPRPGDGTPAGRLSRVRGRRRRTVLYEPRHDSAQPHARLSVVSGA